MAPKNLLSQKACFFLLTIICTQLSILKTAALPVDISELVSNNGSTFSDEADGIANNGKSLENNETGPISTGYMYDEDYNVYEVQRRALPIIKALIASTGGLVSDGGMIGRSGTPNELIKNNATDEMITGYMSDENNNVYKIRGRFFPILIKIAAALARAVAKVAGKTVIKTGLNPGKVMPKFVKGGKDILLKEVPKAIIQEQLETLLEDVLQPKTTEPPMTTTTDYEDDYSDSTSTTPNPSDLPEEEVTPTDELDTIATSDDVKV